MEDYAKRDTSYTRIKPRNCWWDGFAAGVVVAILLPYILNKLF